MRLAQVLTVSILTLAMTAEVAAERRPGLGGKYAARNMTAAQGSLTLLAGPTSSQALGAVSTPFGGGTPGFNFVSLDGGEESLTFTNAGIGAAYGITPELEVGLLLPLALTTPEPFERDLISTLPVFATYGMDLGNFDAGVRVAAYIPIGENVDFGLNLGVPFLFRFGGNSRVDAGIFVPLIFGEEETGKALNVPIRFSQSVTPKIFVGVETGLQLPDFKTDAGAIPFYIHGGYTLLAGGNVVDLGLQVGLPYAVSLAEEAAGQPSGADVLDIQVGTNVQMKF